MISGVSTALLAGHRTGRYYREIGILLNQEKAAVAERAVDDLDDVVVLWFRGVTD
jgi:hypothetical protein